MKGGNDELMDGMAPHFLFFYLGLDFMFIDVP